MSKHVPFQAVQKCGDQYYLIPTYQQYESGIIFNCWRLDLGFKPYPKARVIFDITPTWRERLHHKANGLVFIMNDFQEYVMRQIYETEPYWVRDCIPVDVSVQVAEGMSPDQIRVIFYDREVKQKVEWMKQEDLDAFLKTLKPFPEEGGFYWYPFANADYHVKSY